MVIPGLEELSPEEELAVLLKTVAIFNTPPFKPVLPVLDLPIDIQKKIFQYALTRPDVIRNPYSRPYSPPERYSARERQDPYPSLLLTCRHTFEIAAPLLYLYNEFEFTSRQHFENFMYPICPVLKRPVLRKRAKDIRNITLRIHRTYIFLPELPGATDPLLRTPQFSHLSMHHRHDPRTRHSIQENEYGSRHEKFELRQWLELLLKPRLFEDLENLSTLTVHFDFSEQYDLSHHFGACESNNPDIVKMVSSLGYLIFRQEITESKWQLRVLGLSNVVMEAKLRWTSYKSLKDTLDVLQEDCDQEAGVVKKNKEEDAVDETGLEKVIVKDDDAEKDHGKEDHISTWIREWIRESEGPKTLMERRHRARPAIQRALVRDKALAESVARHIVKESMGFNNNSSLCLNPQYDVSVIAKASEVHMERQARMRKLEWTLRQGMSEMQEWLTKV